MPPPVRRPYTALCSELLLSSLLCTVTDEMLQSRQNRLCGGKKAKKKALIWIRSSESVVHIIDSRSLQNQLRSDVRL